MPPRVLATRPTTPSSTTPSPCCHPAARGTVVAPHHLTTTPHMTRTTLFCPSLSLMSTPYLVYSYQPGTRPRYNLRHTGCSSFLPITHGKFTGVFLTGANLFTCYLLYLAIASLFLSSDRVVIAFSHADTSLGCAGANGELYWWGRIRAEARRDWRRRRGARLLGEYGQRGQAGRRARRRERRAVGGYIPSIDLAGYTRVRRHVETTRRRYERASYSFSYTGREGWMDEG